MATLNVTQLKQKINQLITSNGNGEIEGTHVNELLKDVADSFALVSHSHTKADVSLGDVDNTSDVDKPISTAQQNALDNKVDKRKSTTITHDVDGVLRLNLDDFQFFAVSLEAEITRLELVGGSAEYEYNVLLAQKGAHTLTVASNYPAAASNLTQGENYLKEELDAQSNVIRQRVYRVQQDFQSVDFDTDLANQNIKPSLFFPDSVLPIATLETGNFDLLQIRCINTDQYIITQIPNL